jgi:hypothetical protein
MSAEIINNLKIVFLKTFNKTGKIKNINILKKLEFRNCILSWFFFHIVQIF